MMATEPQEPSTPTRDGALLAVGGVLVAVGLFYRHYWFARPIGRGRQVRRSPSNHSNKLGPNALCCY